MEAEGDIFIYTGGEQEVPFDVTKVRIHASLNAIPNHAFQERLNLVSVEGHAGLQTIRIAAFWGCENLRQVLNISSVTEIEVAAFLDCKCLRHVNIQSVTNIGDNAFYECTSLANVEFGEGLESISEDAFLCCPLQRIIIPLKENLVFEKDCFRCESLVAVDLMGDMRETISSLGLQRWRDEINVRINMINILLPNFPDDRKTEQIQRWYQSFHVHSIPARLQELKVEHQSLLAKYAELLELALWKTKLQENVALGEGGNNNNTRAECRVNCGASVVIPNVISLLPSFRLTDKNCLLSLNYHAIVRHMF